jgi:hypothetical protein
VANQWKLQTDVLDLLHGDTRALTNVMANVTGQ